MVFSDTESWVSFHLRYGVHLGPIVLASRMGNLFASRINGNFDPLRENFA